VYFTRFECTSLVSSVLHSFGVYFTRLECTSTPISMLGLSVGLTCLGSYTPVWKNRGNTSLVLEAITRREIGQPGQRLLELTVVFEY
jgi:hypothetical protein